MANARAVNSLVTFRNSQGYEARGTLVKLTRSTVLFEVYDPRSVVQLSEVLTDLELRRGERLIYRGRAVVSNLVNTGLVLLVAVTLLEPWSGPGGAASSRAELDQELEEFLADWDNAAALQPGYQLVVSQIRSFLLELSRWLEPLDLGGDPQRSAVASPQALHALAPRALAPLAGLFQRFEREAAAVPEAQRIYHKRFVQENLHPLVMCAPFPHRSFVKPLGYAGDYEMVDMMLREPMEGGSAYARLVNYFFLAAGPAEAHRNRIVLLEDWLRRHVRRVSAEGRPLRVLNIACGPAVEIQRYVADEELAEDSRFWLLDFSATTLDYTRGQLAGTMARVGRFPAVEFIEQSVHSLLKPTSRLASDSAPQEYDLVYCAGLFDYLSDRVCHRLLRRFYDWTVPGGQVLATNVHPANTARFLMEDILEWHLVYRDEPMMAALVPGLGSGQRVYADDTGLNVFLEIDKPLP